MDSADSRDSKVAAMDSFVESLPARTLRQIGRHLHGEEGNCDCILAVWSAGRGLRLDLQRVLKPLGLSDVKFGTLLSLYALAPEPSNPADLAYHTGVTRSSMSDVLDQLESCGWVERERPADDKRAIRVSLSGDGRAHVEKAIEVFFHEVSGLTAGLDRAQRASIAGACALLNHTLSLRSPHHSPA